jgi:hypothetical protein
MFAVILANLTALSSTLPRRPTVKMLVTVREYCSTDVTVKGPENLLSIFSSFCQVVLMLPSATNASH